MALHKKGQSTLEYAMVIAIIVAALVAMQIYIKRGLQGRMKSSTDELGEQFSASKSEYFINTTTNSSSSEGISRAGNKTVIDTTSNQWQQVNLSENVTNLSSEGLW